MSEQKITWEYIQGAIGFIDLINMLGVAIDAAGLKMHKKSAGWEWMGYYVENADNFFGVYYDNPLYITFEKATTGESNTVQKLDFEQIHFFSLNKDEQFEKVVSFIKDCFKK